MKNKKFLSVLLCLALLASLPVLPGGAAAADDPADNGMKISKTATPNDDGTYTITLEAYATGSKVTTTVNKDIPTDIVLVLDQSGSMKNDIGTVSFSAYTGKNAQNVNLYQHRHNGGDNNLWHKLDDGSYVSVSVTKTTKYNELSASLPNYSYRSDCYYDYVNNLYEKVGDEYKKVTLTYAYSYAERDYVFTYTFSDGSSITSVGTDTSPDLGNHSPLYTPVADGNDTVYTYTYTDGNGVEQTIDTTTGQNTSFTTLYSRTTSTAGGGSRLNALKSAATTFANAVAAKAAGADGNINTTADNVNHRIAVVGYADTDSDYGYNTGVFIGSTLNRYETAAAGVYGTALQDMNTTGGKNNVTASLNALQASGATRTDYGLTMAKGILDANPVPAGETRNRVVIVFTDGAPTNSNGFKRAVANSAISTANAIKAGGTTVYSIGIFSGADASTAGKEPVEDYYEDYWGPNYTDAEMSAACNWFMQKVSSNNGTPRTPSYYLSAGDAASLNNIFQQISDQIESGGATTELTETSVIKDVVTPYFDLPADSEKVKLYTADSDGGYDKWKDPVAFNGTVDIDEDTSTVGVSGFNFKENWCGEEVKDGTITTFHNGKKLIIEFTVKPKAGFLGGNGVPTNDSAGVYENAEATEPVATATVNPVDVQIGKVDITPADANVYLGASYSTTVSSDEIINEMQLTVGGVPVNLDPTVKNFGLDEWQNEFVDIKVEVKDENGNKVENFEMLEDKKYSVTVTVTPKFNDAAGKKTPVSGNSKGTIHVFTPELTFKDGNVDYQSSIGNTAYTSNGSDKRYAADNYVSSETKWTHINETTGQKMVAGSGDVKMLGTQPNLFLSYEPTSGVTNGKVTATGYVPVKVTVQLNDTKGTDVTKKTTFVHQCDVNVAGGCQWAQVGDANGNPAFLLHVINVVGDLTITKNGLNQHTYTGEKEDQESAIFEVVSVEEPSKKWTVAINGNNSVTLTGLEVGSYTVTELTGWTWRYGSSTLTSDNKNDDETFKVNGGQMTTVTCANSDHNDKWLGGDNYANNVFAGSNTPATD